MTAGSSSHHHLMWVSVRERWISLQASQAVLTEFLLWWELGCLVAIWTLNFKRQNFVVLTSGWTISHMYWIRSHRPQVEKGTITMSWASQWAPGCCFENVKKKPTTNTRHIYSVLQDYVCHEKAQLWEHKGCKAQPRKDTVEKAITHTAKTPS